LRKIYAGYTSVLLPVPPKDKNSGTPYPYPLVSRFISLDRHTARLLQLEMAFWWSCLYGFQIILLVYQPAFGIGGIVSLLIRYWKMLAYHWSHSTGVFI